MTAQVGDTPDSQRARLRRQARSARRALSRAERRAASETVARSAMRLITQRRARRVAAYIHHASELSTAPLLHAMAGAGVAVYLPVAGADGGMHFRRWRGGALRPGAFGILRPVTGAMVFRNALDIVFLPLLGFDARGTRLGAGGGYYDRWLAGRRGVRPLLCGYAFGVQEFSELPRAAWDAPIDAVITEDGFRRLPARS